jgi:hypothetical protein
VEGVVHRRRYFPVFALVLVSPVLFLAGCLGSTGTPPLPEIKSGDYYITRVQVAKRPSVKSDTIVGRVARELGDKARANLSGKSPVVLQVLIDKWTAPGKRFMGGTMADTLFGSASELAGRMRIFSGASKKIIVEHEIVAKFTERGFMSDMAPTKSDEAKRQVIDRFVTMVIGNVN